MVTAMKSLDRAAREALIKRLRKFGAQQEESQHLSDRGSLERAADLMALYEDKTWMDEVAAPSRRSKVPPDDFRRFTKWATENDRLGLQRKQITYLKRTDDVRASLAERSADLAGAAGYALRPLSWMLNNGYADHMAEVWRDARQLAGGEAPYESEVKRALADWKKRNIPKAPGGTRVTGPAKLKRWEQEGERFLREHPAAFVVELERLVARAHEMLD